MLIINRISYKDGRNYKKNWSKKRKSNTPIGKKQENSVLTTFQNKGNWYSPIYKMCPHPIIHSMIGSHFSRCISKKLPVFCLVAKNETILFLFKNHFIYFSSSSSILFSNNFLSLSRNDVRSLRSFVSAYILAGLAPKSTLNTSCR